MEWSFTPLQPLWTIWDSIRWVELFYHCREPYCTQPAEHQVYLIYSCLTLKQVSDRGQLLGLTQQVHPSPFFGVSCPPILFCISCLMSQRKFWSLSWGQSEPTKSWLRGHGKVKTSVPFTEVFSVCVCVCVSVLINPQWWCFLPLQWPYQAGH